MTSGFTFGEFQSLYESFKAALAVYSQPFVLQQRAVDPDKLCRVMFLCGMSTNQHANITTNLEFIDRVVEDAAMPEDQKLATLYQKYSHLHQ